MHELLQDKRIVFFAMSIIIFLLTQILKQPIKLFTKKISNERGRRIANIIVLTIPYALGVLAEYLYSKYVGVMPFTVITGITFGAGAVALYGFVERFFKMKNPYATKDGKLVTDTVDEITKDGKFDEKDVENVKDKGKKLLKKQDAKKKSDNSALDIFYKEVK